MTTFVFIHGGGHGGWCWQRLAPLLEAAGHRVFTPTLTGLAERAHERNVQTNLTTHIADVVALFDQYDLNDAILLGHSYGGMVITGAADRLGRRVKRLVYLDAVQPRHTEALIDTSPGAEERLMQGVQVIDDVPLCLFPTADILRIVYGLEGADAAWALQHLTPHPLACFVEKLELQDQDAMLAIPRTSIDCAATLALRTDALRARVASCDPRHVIDSAHDVMITQPEAIAALLLT